MTRRLVLMALAALLGGCSTVSGWFGSDDKTEPPAPLTDFSPTVSVRTLWSRDAGASGKGQLLDLRAAVRGGRVAVADPKGRVTLFDAESGTSIWETATRTPISAGPTVGSGVVAVGTADGQVLALEVDGGAIRWQTRVTSEVLSPPAVGAGIVAVRTVDGRLFGLDLQSGRRVWVFDKGVPLLSLRGTGDPVIAGELVLNGFDGGRLVAVAARDGRQVWEARIAAARGRSDLERMVDIDSAPVVTEDAVYAVAYRGQVAAIDPTSGRAFWQKDLSSSAGLAVDARSVFVTDERSVVWALDRYSGRVLWQQDRMKLRGLTAPVMAGRYVVVGDFEGYLHWLRREDGELAARARVDSAGFYSAPETAGGVIYAYGRGGTVEALRAGD